MSEQLVGVLVGALIGFAGTALITLLQWYMEKEKRREERLWRYRQEHMQRLRPGWEQVYGSLFQALAIAGDIAELVDSYAAAQERARAEEASATLLKHAQGISEQAANLQRQVWDLPDQVMTLLTVHEVELGTSMRKHTGQAFDALGNLLDVMQLVLDSLIRDPEHSPDEIAKMKEQLAECRKALVASMRQIETAVQRYITIQ